MRVLSAAVIVCGLATGPSFAAPPGALFGMLAVRAPSLAGLPQWRRALHDIGAEQAIYLACAANATACPSEQASEWQQFIAELAGRPRLEQVREVHRYANRWPYRTDHQVWGRSDHWSSPLQFLVRSGDCEDFAILKYVSLRLLGVPATDLRLVVLQDTARDLAHAVLTVSVDGATHVLDNLLDDLAPPAALPHYVPYYSVNEEDRWVHVSEQAVVVSSATR